MYNFQDIFFLFLTCMVGVSIHDCPVMAVTISNTGGQMMSLANVGKAPETSTDHLGKTLDYDADIREMRQKFLSKLIFSLY